MMLDNMTGITKGSYTGNDMFCKSQLITCRFVKSCNGVCPFEDALKHADQTADEQNVIDHDRDWIIGCLEHDGFIHTHRFDKANQIILEALQEWIPCSERLPNDNREVLISCEWGIDIGQHEEYGWRSEWINHYDDDNVLAWMPLPKPYKGGDTE